MVDQISSGSDPIASAMMQANINLSEKVGVTMLKKSMDTKSELLNQLMKGMGKGNSIDSLA